MADDKKISELPEVTSANPTDFLTLMRGGDPAGTKNKKITSDNYFASEPDPANTFTISASGADYTTIQAALDANTSGGEVFIVYPGTYANDTINFTANNQSVVGVGAIDQQTVTNSTQILDWSAFTGCHIEKIKMALTGTSNVALGGGTGAFDFDFCELESNLSGTFGGTQVILNAGGNVNLSSVTITGNNSVVAGAGIKAAINLAAGTHVELSKSTVNISNSNSAQVSTLFYGTASGTFRTSESTVVVEDNDATTTVGIANVTGTGSSIVSYNKVTVTNNTNAANGYLASSSGTLSVRGMFNNIEVISSGGTATVFATLAPVVTFISQFEDLIAPNILSGPGAYVYANSDNAGDLVLSGNLSADVISYDTRIGGTSGLLGLVAANGITSVNFENLPIESSTAGPITITANPAIAAGTNGQRLRLIGVSDTKTVTWNDGNGLSLANGQSFTVGNGDTLEFIFYNGVWIETSRNKSNWNDNLDSLEPRNARNIQVAQDQSYFIGENADTLDQQQTVGSNTSTLTDAWQSVTSALTGNLVRVDIYFSTTPPTDTRMRIYTGEGIGGTLLSTVPAAAYGTGWQSFVLPAPPYIIAGTQFTIRLDGVAGTGLRWRFNLGGDVYAGGRWIGGATSDARFRTYVLQTLFAAWKEGIAIVGDFKAIAQNNTGTSTFKIYNDAAGQVTELELNEGATKLIGFSNDPNETGDLDKKVWTIEAQKQHVKTEKDWQDAVISQLDFTSSEPASPSVGDRYIITITGTSSVTAQSVTRNYIYEWNGTSWTETVTEEGCALWDKNLSEYQHLTATTWIPLQDVVSILNLNRYVAVSPNGGGSNSGLNVDVPKTSLVSAMAAAVIFSPAFTNPVLVETLDGDDYVYGSGGFTIPSYTTLRMKGATLNASDITINDYSHSFIARHSVSSLGYLKSSGSAWASISATRFAVLSAEGIRCTSGRIDAEFQNVDITAGNLIAQFCDGDVNVDVSGKVNCSSTGLVAIHDSNGRVNMRLNDVQSAADGFDMSSGAGYNTLYANRVKASGQAFDISNAGKFLSGIFCEVEETIASDTTYMNYIATTYRRTGAPNDKHMVLRNIDGIVLETPQVKVGDPQPFTNLATGLVAVNHTFQKNSVYKIIVEATNGSANIFQIEIGYNGTVPEIVSGLPNGAASYSSPMGAINYTNVAGQDRYAIAINGFGFSYSLYITRATGAATLTASGSTTGTTTLTLIPIIGL